MEKKGWIGVFDSGYGGLTILDEIISRMPEYNYMYLGDNARAPYGTRSFDVVYDYTLEAVKELFNNGCELVVLACNTASAKALRTIQQKDLPNLSASKRVLGVIRPSTEIIGTYSKSNHIGILATEGTVLSNSYPLEIAKFSTETVVTQHACPIWVPLIENDLFATEPGKAFIKKDVETLLLKDPNIDTLILACTHYPILKEYIESIVSADVKVVAQGSIVAERLEDYLNRHTELSERCLKNGLREFLTSENTKVFNKNAAKFIDYPVASKHIKLG